MRQLPRSIAWTALRTSPILSGAMRPPFQNATDNKSLSKSYIASRAPTYVAPSNPQDLYGNSSSRWLWNEETQRASHTRKFDVAALADVAARAAGSRSCTRLEKLAEGSCNKAFLLTMDDGKEMVAKLPNPNAGHKHFTTASEVATMDYVRSLLGIPAPQVYAWSSSTDNDVGAEYILMEKCRGVELRKVWDRITARQKAGLIRQLVGYEAALASLKFPMYGSLYYASDLAAVAQNQIVAVETRENSNPIPFAVGPTTDRKYFEHGRSNIDVHRGPWPTLEDYNLAIAQRELACLEAYPQFPDPQGFYNGPGQYQQSSETKTRVLKDFAKVVNYLKPQDPALSAPVLWHTDLHLENIFVNEQDPTEITAIIDWQAIHIAPLYAQARHPTFLRFEGEKPDSSDASTITLPANYEELGEAEQKAAKELRRARYLWKLYELEMACQSKHINRAARFKDTVQGGLPSFAGTVFSDGELLVQDLLMQLHDQWDQVVGVAQGEACPLSFTKQDEVLHEGQMELWKHSIDLMTQFLDAMGGYRGWDGSVSLKQYDVGKASMNRYKEDFIVRHSTTEADRQRWIEVWPFKG